MELHLVRVVLENTENRNQEIRLDVRAEARTDRYPITFTLQLELRDGDHVNGVALGSESIEWAAADLRGKIATERFTLWLPESGAYFSWPHDPYNTYDHPNHRSPRAQYVSLVHVPVGPDGVRLRY